LRPKLPFNKTNKTEEKEVGTMRKIIWSLVAIPLVLGLTAAPASAAVRQSTLSIPVHADGTWTFDDGRVESHTADFGVITNVGDGLITVIRPDRQQVTVALPDTTCVRVGGMPGRWTTCTPTCERSCSACAPTTARSPRWPSAPAFR
jgi:hypothetical protein